MTAREKGVVEREEERRTDAKNKIAVVFGKLCSKNGDAVTQLYIRRQCLNAYVSGGDVVGSEK